MAIGYPENHHKKTKEFQRVGKADLGSKRTCPECGARFFDLKKKNPECLKCGTVCEDPKPAKPRRGVKPAASVAVPVAAPPAAPAADEAATEAQDPVLAAAAEDLKEDAEAKVIDSLALGEEDKDLKDVVADEDDDELIEDTSDLGKDADDVSEVMEHVDDGVTDKV